MAQTWDSTVPSTTTNIFTDNVNSRSNEESLRSNFSGTSYPLTPVQGQVCYRTDLEQEYTFNGSIWVESNSNSTISNEVKLSRGSLTSLDDRLSVSINPDGTLKSDIDLNISEFIISGLVPTYVSTTSFTVPEDQTGVFTAGRMLRASLATSYVYSNISTSVYNSSPNTTTVTLKDAVLDSGLNKLAYTVIQKTNAESMTNIPAGNISSTNVQAAINELDNEKLGKAGGTMAGSLILASDPTENLQATTKQYVDNNSSGGSVGVTNYIASGGKFGTPSGFILPIESRVESISNKKITRTANDITLNPRKAVLVYDKVDGTTDKLEAVYPDSVASTVHRWIINGDATISSTIGTNNLTKTGTITASDGIVGYAGLGAGGHYTAANATNVPAYASAFTFRLLIDNFVSNGAAQCFYHDGVRKVSCNATNNLLVGEVDTGYTLTNGSSYIVEVKGIGSTTTGDVFVDGISVYSGAVVINAAVVTPFILSNTSSAELCYSKIGYVEILSTQTTAQVSGEIATNLLFPVSYDKSEAAYPTTGVNLLTANQSSVETDLTGFTARATATPALLTKDDTASVHGNACLKCVTAGASASEGYYTPAQSVMASSPYSASVYLKGNGTILLRLAEFNSSIAILSTTDLTIALTNEWKKYSVSRTFGSTAMYANISIQTLTVQATTFYADCFQLEQSSSATAWQLGNNGYHEWKFDETSGTAVADSAGTLNGVATGTTIVDSELGLGKARRFAGGTDKLTCGAFTFPSSFAVLGVVTARANSVWGGIMDNRSSLHVGNFISFNNGNSKIYLYSNDSSVISTHPMPQNKPAFFAVNYANNLASMYIDSPNIDSVQNIAINTSLSNSLIIGSTFDGYGLIGDIDYLLIIPRALSQMEIAEIYDALMNKSRKSLKDRLPADAISLGYAYAGSNGITDLNDADWGYARHEKAYGGNRVVPMDYKSVVALSPDSMQWTPPFGSGAKFRTDWRSAENADGMNEFPAVNYYMNGTDYGVVTMNHKNGKVASYVGSGGVTYVNGAWRTGGYLRPIFTCLEDD